MATADQRKLQDPGINGDRLSALPDEILSHILSFLETKSAVGTTILSRRWKDHWTRVSNLDLVDSPYVSRSKSAVHETSNLVFSRFVDRVLSEHKNLNSLRRLRLHFSRDSKVSSSFFCNMELGSASQLEEIDIRHSSQCGRGLPESFYTLKNLKVLKLDFVKIMPVHGSVFLPSVKTLQLLSVQFIDCESLARLFSGCPVVETVRLEYCYSSISDENENYMLTASIPSLKNLTIIGAGGYDCLCLIVMESPRLQHLHLEDFDEFQFLGSSQLSCLVSARIDTGWSQEHSLIGFLTQISNAKELWLSWQIPSLLTVLVQDVQQLPVFPKLKHLTLEDGGSSCILHPFLNSASMLQSLVIRVGDGQARTQWEESDLVRTPECLLSSLEEIQIDGLAAFEDGMKMIAYLLKNGAVLKKVNICVFKIDLDINDRKFLASLLKLPRGSSACEAHLFHSNKEIHIDSNDEDDFDNDSFSLR